METVTLYRPVGSAELRLIEESGWAAFPPRLPEQPIFYPVTNEAYAAQIAQDWNAKHNDDHRGYVTRFCVRSDFLVSYRREIVGGREHEEYWIPAGHLRDFNAAIVGGIEVVAEFRGDGGGVAEPEATIDLTPTLEPYDASSEAIWTPEAVAGVERAEAELASGGGVSHAEVMRRTAEMLGR